MTLISLVIIIAIVAGIILAALGVSSRYNKWKPPCEKCGSHDRRHNMLYTRGYNNWCRQACGDGGTRCYDCGHMVWDQTLEEYKAKLPDWCEAYKDRV